MALTKAQQNAVDVRDRTLLVSAAAGSGKTYTLTQRIIKAIIEDGQDLSRLLIVTFTRAAAGELKAKIAKAIGEAIAKHPDNIHLQKQLIRLGNAHISTIDSFFSEPVRANFEKLGLPASMRLSDDAELAPIREKIMQETLNSFFDKCGEYSNESLASVGYSNAFTDLLGIISGARDTSGLVPTFWDIYTKLITSPEGLEQLKSHSTRFKENSTLDFFDTIEGKAMKRELYDTVRFAYKTFRKCADDMQDDELIASKYTDCFLENASGCHTILLSLENGKYADVKAAFEAYAPGRIPSMPSSAKSERSEYFKNIRGEINDKIKDIRAKYLYEGGEKLQTLFSMYSEMCSVLYAILVEFESKYNEEKKRKGICEFSDMPRFMLTLLRDSKGNPTEYAKTLSESFDEVYIDEYQDVNEIQDTIFALIGKGHRFMVGDIKQSIYGFREAEPSIFADYRRKFPLYNEDNDSTEHGEHDGSTIFMSENFRCDENVIKFTNTVCSDIFSAFSESIGYTSDDDLKFGKGRPYPEYSSPKVTLNIVQTPPDTDGDEGDGYAEENDNSSSDNASNLHDEAIVTANQIAQILREEKNADGTPVSAGNIAILVRSHKHAKPIIDALGALNIKCALSSKGELFENVDMQLLVNLLSVIDNPRADMPLCHLLTSSSECVQADFSLEEIVKIRKFADRSKSLYDGMILYAESGDDADISRRCSLFLDLIRNMRSLASKLSADKLIKSISSSEKYAPLTLTDAYTYLYDSACKFVKNTWSSLYSFIRYFKDLMEHGEAGSEPDTKNRDAVTVMSIHQSKGLEFNVCVLFGFGKRFNMSNRYPLIFNKECGPSMKLPPILDDDTDRITKISMRYENNPIFKTVDRCNQTKQLEEEARIFYVALTRARERLYISATLSKPYEEYLGKLKNCADLDYEIKKSKTYLNWILLSLMRADEDIFTVNVYDKGAEQLSTPFKKNSIQTEAKATSEIDKSLSLLLESSGARRESEDRLSTVPSKVAASKVSANMLDDSVFSPIPSGKIFSESDEDSALASSDSFKAIKKRIELMRSSPMSFDDLLATNKKPTAAEIGTAAHAFLQFCDYESVMKNSIDQEIERLKNERFITERTANIILKKQKKQLECFFESDIFACVRGASEIRREFKFGMFRDACDFTQSDDVKELVKNKRIYVQGSIDLVIKAQNGDIILCDYKTDRVSAYERQDRALLTNNMKEKHGNQLAQYSYAIEKIFGKAPKSIYIYLLDIGESVEIT